MFKCFSLSHLTAGFVAVLVGFTSSAVLVFQAATLAGASPAEISSWIFALGCGIAIASILLSLVYRMPILVGWSTPGAALLVTSLTGVTMPEAVGAFCLAAALTIVVGITGLFEKLMSRIPPALTAAMLAGILLHFGMNVFVAMEHQAPLVISMLIGYLIGKRFFPRYVIVMVLLLGITIAKAQGLFHMEPIHFAFASPIFTMPVFSLSAFISIAIPLFIVTMTSQNIPGVTVLKSNGYYPRISPLITTTGLVTLLLAPFGNYSICLAAITAGISAGKEADRDPKQRYKATIVAGILWLLIGLFGATVVSIFSAFPIELVLALAGIALFSTIGSSLKTALEDNQQREPAIITLLVSGSGISLLGIGSPVWGLTAGILASFLLNTNTKLAPLPTKHHGEGSLSQSRDPST